MGIIVRIASVAVQIFAYGLLLSAGALFWYYGWKGRNDTLRTVGDVTVLIGLVADVALVTSNWMFNWSGWLEAAMMR